MSSQPRLNIQGQAPFKQSGVYEAQIAITDSKPSDDAIRSKQFQFLWRGSFHLRVNNGIFSETIGTESNPLPSSITNLDKIWIVVTDLFSPLHTVFDVPLARPTTQSENTTMPTDKSETK
ncbi:MAG: collagen-like protein, partial [Nitrosopumilus sp.]|nr:collagen-like protein [Nitrosopumilus sp.]